MDAVERAFLAVAAMGIAMLVALIGLLTIGLADPVPASVLQSLNGFHPAAAFASEDLMRAAGHKSASRG
jgi:hypothetical protein